MNEQDQPYLDLLDTLKDQGYFYTKQEGEYTKYSILDTFTNAEGVNLHSVSDMKSTRVYMKGDTQVYNKIPPHDLKHYRDYQPIWNHDNDIGELERVHFYYDAGVSGGNKNFLEALKRKVDIPDSMHYDLMVLVTNIENASTKSLESDFFQENPHFSELHPFIQEVIPRRIVNSNLSIEDKITLFKEWNIPNPSEQLSNTVPSLDSHVILTDSSLKSAPILPQSDSPIAKDWDGNSSIIWEDIIEKYQEKDQQPLLQQLKENIYVVKSVDAENSTVDLHKYDDFYSIPDKIPYTTISVKETRPLLYDEKKAMRQLQKIEHEQLRIKYKDDDFHKLLTSDKTKLHMIALNTSFMLKENGISKEYKAIDRMGDDALQVMDKKGNRKWFDFNADPNAGDQMVTILSTGEKGKGITRASF